MILFCSIAGIGIVVLYAIAMNEPTFDINYKKWKKPKEHTAEDTELSVNVSEGDTPAKKDLNEDYYYRKLKEASKTRMAIDLLALKKYHKLKKMQRKYGKRY